MRLALVFIQDALALDADDAGGGYIFEDWTDSNGLIPGRDLIK